MTELLSPLDATFLELEDADRSAHMHIGGILVFDGPAPGLDELRARLEERLAALPRYRQRLTSRTARGLRRPGWEDDPDFDIATHITRAALPAPGGERELLDWAGDFYSHRLDRARPLWRSVLLEGLEDGRWALATKTHHCLVDGVGARDAATVMLDTSPAPPPWRAPDAAASAARTASCTTSPASPRCPRASGSTEPAASSTSRCATSWSRRRTRASTCRSASIAGWRSPTSSSSGSGRSARRSAARSTTSCSRSSPRGCAGCCSRATRSRPRGVCAPWCP